MMMATSLLEYFMARARIQLKQLRKLLSLTYENNLSLRETAQLSGISRTTISEYLVRFRRSGISYDESLNLSDIELVELLEEKKQEESEQYTKLVSLFPEYSRRLKKRGMTKQLLWKEYRSVTLTGTRTANSVTTSVSSWTPETSPCVRLMSRET
jgi:predicted DNA-binding protein YlxM (UPF0122 family)